jgi:hypothetical protein
MTDRGGARNPEAERGYRICGTIPDNDRGRVVCPDMGFFDLRIPTTRINTGKKHPQISGQVCRI